VAGLTEHGISAQQQALNVVCSPSRQYKSSRMPKLKTSWFIVLMLALSSYDLKPLNKVIGEIQEDSLGIFPPNSWMAFINNNRNDQIALHLKKTSTNTLEFRIELLRKWRPLPGAQGVLRLQRIESDSIYVLEGSNSECEVKIKIYNAKQKFESGRKYIKIERDCVDDFLDIPIDAFEKLWYK
jgi:hypothetical protein